MNARALLVAAILTLSTGAWAQKARRVKKEFLRKDFPRLK